MFHVGEKRQAVIRRGIGNGAGVKRYPLDRKSYYACLVSPVHFIVGLDNRSGAFICQNPFMTACLPIFASAILRRLRLRLFAVLAVLILVSYRFESRVSMIMGRIAAKLFFIFDCLVFEVALYFLQFDLVP